MGNLWFVVMENPFGSGLRRHSAWQSREKRPLNLFGPRHGDVFTRRDFPRPQPRNAPVVPTKCNEPLLALRWKISKRELQKRAVSDQPPEIPHWRNWRHARLQPRKAVRRVVPRETPSKRSPNTCLEETVVAAVLFVKSLHRLWFYLECPSKTTILQQSKK